MPTETHSSNSFYHKLVSLNQKIGVFKNQFYSKQPRKQMSYDNVLRKQKMDFSTFKTLYGHNEMGPKNVKFGGDFVSVDNKNYTITNINSNDRDEVRKRLLGGTIASQ